MKFPCRARARFQQVKMSNPIGARAMDKPLPAPSERQPMIDAIPIPHHLQPSSKTEAAQEMSSANHLIGSAGRSSCVGRRQGAVVSKILAADRSLRLLSIGRLFSILI